MRSVAATLWPRNERELRARFEQCEFASEEIPKGSQGGLLLKLLALYESKGLSPATSPLCDCCVNNTRCWRAAMKARRTPTKTHPENGGIMLPWVGSRYRRGGVAVIAINPNIGTNDRTHLLSEHEISWDRHHRVLENNLKTDEGSPFAYRTLRSTAAILDRSCANPIRDREQPQDLVGALHHTARLQAVKCVPRTARSRPTGAMEHTCPRFLLEAELGILRPRFILTLGTVPDWAISQLPGYEYLDHASSEYLWRHRLHCKWGSAEVFGIPHPSDPRGGWFRGHQALLRSLRT